MKLASVVLLLVVVLAGCGGDDNGSGASSGTESVYTTPPTAWDGPPDPAEDGTIDVTGFNEYAKSLPDEQRVPRELAFEFLQVESPPYEIEEVEDETPPSRTTVTLTQDNLEDDSVRARRYTLVFAHASQDDVNLSSARVDYQCQQNRGHQEFGPQLCL